GPAFCCLLEPLQGAAHTPVDDPQRGTDVLDEPLRVVLDVEVHPCRALVELVEGDDPGVARAAHALPGDPCVRFVGRHACFPLFISACDVCQPMETARSLTSHLLDPLHEGGEPFELPEQAVSLRDGNVHVDRFIECRHGC